MYLSIITLSVNGVNLPIKRYGMDERIKIINKTHIYNTLFIAKNTDWNWRDGKIYFLQMKTKKLIVIPISDKIDFKPRSLIRVKKGISYKKINPTRG